MYNKPRTPAEQKVLKAQHQKDAYSLAYHTLANEVDEFFIGQAQLKPEELASAFPDSVNALADMCRTTDEKLKADLEQITRTYGS